MDNFEINQLKIVHGVLKEFAYGFGFYTTKRSLQDLDCGLEKLEVILSKIRKFYEFQKESQKFFKEWGCHNDIQIVEFSEEEIKISIKALQKIFEYLDDEDIGTRIGYTSNEIKETKQNFENFLSTSTFGSSKNPNSP